ncbi:DENN (AEX-3) domain protein (macronuclear) [Tetrahymena thermophila SB210]|uniref:DENN (AEX-3) domain protein n=1 Tax=Tetrahymena thermophila (strain SB210) TaxID=312017 RepID=Q22ZD3_TETTS|nr:DENN (AEX-3) domain protein [Tetrahymena thermophila SB210]EAR90388.3 DENN (AEX-3) domain protein [Tetrahymena thermophila SB210]|eukprot:XP_001010633.3 DENN (AEX-3) domain protein [Tetrahymena thermophila SB210]
MDNNNEKVTQVFERFIVMGVNTKTKDITYEKIINNDFTVDLIDIAPYLPQNKVPQYIEGMKDFLFPDGLKIYDDNLNVMNDPQPLDTFKLESQHCKQYEKINKIHQKDLIFHFVTTDGDSTKRYCTALIFHEKFYIKNDQKYNNKKQLSKCLPKIPIQQIIKNPLILDEDTDTIYIPKAICLISRLPFFQSQRQFLQYYYHNIIMGRIIGIRKRIIPIPNKLISVFNGLILEAGIKKAEKLWDNNYNEIASKLDKEIAIQYKVKETHLTEFYLSYIFFLMNIPSDDISISLHRSYKDDNKQEDLIFKCNFSSRETISLPNFSFGPLLRRNLTQINLLKLIKNILLERFILIFSSSPGEIPCLTESILKLIQPLNHINIYVPFASLHHLWLLESLGTSAIIGFSKVYKQQILERLNEIDRAGKIVVIVDLDANTIEEDTFLNIQLPSKAKGYIIKELTKAEYEYKQSREKNAWEKTVIEISRSFFNFILCLVNDYTQFYKQEVINQINNAQTEEDLDQFRNQKYQIDDIFNRDDYLKMFPLEDQSFMREFIKNTMMFSYLIQQTYEVLYLKKYKRKSILELQEGLNLIKRQKDQQSPQLQTKLGFPQNVYIDFENEQLFSGLITSQNLYISKIMNCKEDKLSIYPYLIKWIKYLELFKIENLEGKKKKAEPVSFWKRFWQENILHFVDSEQRQQNRDQLNIKTTLYKIVDRRKFLNLNNLFQKSILSGSFSLYQDRIKLPTNINYNPLSLKKNSSTQQQFSQEDQVYEEESLNSNNSECTSGNLEQIQNTFENQAFLSYQCTPVNQRRTQYEQVHTSQFQHYCHRMSQQQTELDGLSFVNRMPKKHMTVFSHNSPMTKFDEKLPTYPNLQSNNSLNSPEPQNVQSKQSSRSRSGSVLIQKTLEPIKE